MRFAAAAAVLATTVMAGTDVSVEPTSTAFVTEHVTITQCPETVTNCPARSKTTTTSVITHTVPMTTSTVWSTKVHTIISCAPTVTNCPAHSTVTSTETIAVSTTICPVGSVSTSVPWSNSTLPGGNQPTGGNGSQPPAQSTGGNQPTGPNSQPPAQSTGGNQPTSLTTQAPACPTHSVTAITKSYTTVLTSVEYQTIAIPCPTGPAGQSSAQPPAQSTGAPVPSTGGNQTCNGANCPKPPVSNGASGLVGSAVFAAVAGVAAFVLA